MFESRAWFVRPGASVVVHFNLAARNGAELWFDEQLQAWEETSNSVHVCITNGVINAGHLVISPGALAPWFLYPPLRVKRQVYIWFAPPGGVEPIVDHPVYVAERALGQQIYGCLVIKEPDGGFKVAFF